MNTFDLVMSAALAISLVAGFYTGLLRSLASILGYVIATPIALGVSSYAMPAADQGTSVWVQTFLVFLAALLVAGLVIGHLLKISIRETFGGNIDVVDRIIGAGFGAIRVAMIGLVLVLVFDRIIPPDRQPGFLADSKLRPVFSAAGQSGLKSLPPDLIAYIDRIKRDRHL